jgi:hypothetical protein
MAQKTYSSYHALRLALRRDGYIKKTGSIATLLLDTFLDPARERAMNSTEVYDLGLAVDRSENNFTAWRSNLCKKGWLKHSVTSETGSFLHNNNRYRPGPKLVKYITREKLALKEIASVEDVMVLTKDLASNEELNSLKETVGSMERDMSRILNIIDPPDDPHKREKLRRGEYDARLRTLRVAREEEDMEEPRH